MEGDPGRRLIRDARGGTRVRRLRQESGQDAVMTCSRLEKAEVVRGAQTSDDSEGKFDRICWSLDVGYGRRRGDKEDCEDTGQKAIRMKLSFTMMGKMGETG